MPTRKRLAGTTLEEHRNAALRKKREWMRAHRRNNPEAYRARDKARRKRKNETTRAYYTRLRAYHPFIWKAKYCSKELTGAVAITGQQLAALYKRQHGCCALTGRPLTKQNMEVDHAFPRSRGGSGTLENLRWTNRDVNIAKRDLTTAEFVALCRDVVSMVDEGVPHKDAPSYLGKMKCAYRLPVGRGKTKVAT